MTETSSSPTNLEAVWPKDAIEAAANSHSFQKLLKLIAWVDKTNVDSNGPITKTAGNMSASFSSRLLWNGKIVNITEIGESKEAPTDITQVRITDGNRTVIAIDLPSLWSKPGTEALYVTRRTSDGYSRERFELDQAGVAAELFLEQVLPDKTSLQNPAA